ncbi:MAG TPA: coenzyme F420-0:L-glutamate ligase [Solirubrobacteraceae bacterium]|jgi:coenzyme F420-0:L-glutamate ligase/coenzyme F420-1:gamma-L-glutamate ligase|nr:coenzyme F420-0:L-glutamate ligase [Solirubrobacteraceae bacterium]
MGELAASALGGIPEIADGADLGALIAAAAAGGLGDGDIVVVAHKAVSKAQGRLRRLAEIEPGEQARELAAALGKDPRHVQAILDESEELVRAERGVLIVRTRHGFVCANAGIDESNAPADGTLVLLPLDPDGAARELRARLRELTGASPAVLITDSFGRAWRHGQLDCAIGVAGLAALDDWRGRGDRRGRELHASIIAVADAVAAAADLARAKDSGEPVVIVRGLGHHVQRDDGPGAAALIRSRAEDLFR